MAANTFRDPAFIANREEPIHRWVPWIAGFSKQFIEDALGNFTNGHTESVLDPFAGVGTTLVESDIAGHDAIGFEINPYAAFAARVKLQAYRVPIKSLRNVIHDLHSYAVTSELDKSVPISNPPAGFRTRSPFYSPEVERKVLLMFDFLNRLPEKQISDLTKLAFASTMVEFSNYSYEPSLGRRATVGRAEVSDFPVAEHVAQKLSDMADDSGWYRQRRVQGNRPDSKIHLQSFFDGYERIPSQSIDLIVTSPPYANNYHYSRNTRPHLYWLGFCESPKELRQLEDLNFGTYWQRARELEFVELDPRIEDNEIKDTIEEIRCRNSDRGIYGGRGWANYITTYINDCLRFLTGVKWCLRPGATALVVIGNSIVQGVNVPTDRFLASIAALLGLHVSCIHTPRETRVGNSIINSSVRIGSAGARASLYESVVEIHQP